MRVLGAYATVLASSATLSSAFAVSQVLGGLAGLVMILSIGWTWYEIGRLGCRVLSYDYSRVKPYAIKALAGIAVAACIYIAWATGALAVFSGFFALYTAYSIATLLIRK